MNLKEIQAELTKRLDYPYTWGKIQDDEFDRKTNFIYNIFYFNELLLKIETVFKGNERYSDYFNYSINRWYNFWSACTVEEIFRSHTLVKPIKDSKDKRADFKINEIWFDHKTTIYPTAFGKPVEYAMKNPQELIKWLYENQSQQQRKHYFNRIFIVLYNPNGDHWKLKAEIGWLKKLIMNYLDNFDKSKLLRFYFKEKKLTFSDIIWGIKS